MMKTMSCYAKKQTYTPVIMKGTWGSSHTTFDIS